MFPLRDINPALHRPIAVMLILLVNAGAWTLVQGFGQDLPLARSLCEYALIPGELLRLAPVGTVIPVSPNFACQLEGDASAWTLVTHMFLHGGWFHIIGNMWFLWVFGDNVEDAMGPLRFVAFYVLCGLAAAAAQIASDPGAAVPMVGASGAIGGVMGAYARLYPRTQVITLIFLGFYWTTVAIPAFAMLGYWFFIQLISGLPALGSTSGGVAFWAHVGGFLAGVLLIGPMHRPDYLIRRAQQMERRFFDSRHF
ncbi:rhomboid family intramembrane serine protease [Methylococcus capsulatus]|uniref:rhomboid family intramembrane serine protease n=1 Tax=Methylococcus capsulatus TaxID=414 RepID=UPI001C52D108|nr:rhomboid family intramembrane serine protease [Methylococcus capsulatus]QXP86833.1 rhomboid family intramembrane serine protease [Methylococcus capsulatus]QXP93489.1 rhomboid family intramembrane serine protease [Methylococcus capsulatus]UQN11807.1 rhomboid family intramembrane serine protease [Methylococcus capsulatus]